MNILLANYEYKPQCGGAGLGIYNMSKAFAKMGHNVTLIIGWDYSFGEPEIIEGVETHIIRIKKKNIQQSTPLGMLKYVTFGILKIESLVRIKKYDIIQFYFSVPTGLLKYGIKKNIPYVISLRGMDIPGLNDDHKTLSKMTKQINRRIALSAAAITCLSSEASKHYKKLVPERHIDIIPNAVDFSAYSPKDAYSDHISKFIAVARLTGVKRLSLLIKALASIREQYDDVKLDIYGDGPEREALNNLIYELDAGDYIRLMGFYERDALAPIMRDYDAFTLFSVGDSFGMAYIEAMAVGLPILCARAGGPIDIIRDYETGIFALPDDLESTIGVLRYGIEHPKNMRKMGERGREDVINNYSVEAIAKKHIALYEKCLNDK